MPSLDTSRHLLDTRLHYTTAMMQQGRVLTDADWNEMVLLESEDRRQIIAETVCTEGSPNDGFKIGVPTPLAVAIYPGTPPKTTIQSYEFSFGAGSFYLGGYRFTCNPAEQAESFASQMDWMSMALGTGNFPDLPVAPRTDIAFLHGWHDTVSSTEDQEFRERALGGPDTTVRVRRMRRVEVLPNVVATNCAEARAALRQHLIQPRPGDTGGPHSFSAEGTELLSKTRLTVSFVATGTDADPCKPSQVRGFIGAENQAIRVQLTTAKRFIWGIDNAAPIYRVQVDASDPTQKTLKFLTLPRDQAAMPLLEQAIELLPWGSLLANNEKAADAQGFVTPIDGTYDPDSQTVLLHDAVPANMIQWLADQPASLDGRFDATGQKQYFYARVWTGGADQDFVPGTAITLTDTGLAVTFSDFGIPGDHWIIAARPNTPDQLVPWRLLDGAAPHGPRRYYTALALINWTVPGGAATATVRDCRERFRSLCRNNGCCQVIVGDGTTSFGDFTSIQAAIDSLPAEGGEVCVLRGVYREALSIVGRTNIVIHGCGNDTLIVPDAGPPAAITIERSRTITLRNFAVEAPTMVGVAAFNRTSDVILRALKITARDQSAVIAKLNRGLIVESCVLQAQPLVVDLAPGGTVGVTPLLYVAGDEIRVEMNLIEVDPKGTSRRSALGGMQVGGGSTDVEIRRNRIRGGNGVGIMLGSIHYVQAGVVSEDDGSSGGYTLTVVFWYYDPNLCIFIPGDLPPPPDGNGTLVPVSEGNLERVLIIENRIELMGQSGIAPALLYFPEGSPDLITITELAILANTIWKCMQLEVGAVSLENIYRVAFGGIILPDVEIARIERNVIEEVGTGARDAICGIFAVLATGIAIRENRLRHNGREAVADQPIKLGYRGGIVLPFVIAPTETLIDFLGTSPERQDGMPAVVVHDNVVVSREGRALQIGGIGPISITDNQLTAHGTSILSLIKTFIELLSGQAAATGSVTTSAGGITPSAAVVGLLLDALGGSAVLVFDVAFSNEIYLQILGLDSVRDMPDPIRRQKTYFVGGNVLFADNQVTYDAVDQVFAFSLCAVLLFSLDTVTLADNQIECDLLVGFVILNTLAIGFSTQVTGNRWMEGILNAYLSAITLGVFMNSTAHNTATHCVLTAGAIEPSARVSGGGPVVDMRLNLVLTDPTGNDETCGALEGRFARLNKSLGGFLSNVLHYFNL